MPNKVRYKILTNDLKSPYQDHQYQLGEWVTELRTGEPGEGNCIRGLYATSIEGLLYRGVNREGESVFCCEVKGKQAGELPFKERWEKLKVVEKLSEAQVRELAREQHKKLGYLLEEALYPVNPLLVKRKQPEPTEAEIELLKQWANVWANVWDSVWANVWDSVWDSVWANVGANVGANVWDSVWDSVWANVGANVGANVRVSVRVSVWANVWANVWDSVWASVGAYVGSLFPDVKTWKGVNHELGEYPFQSGADLWRAGLISSYDGKVWRLHSGPEAKVVWEGEL